VGQQGEPRALHALAEVAWLHAEDSILRGLVISSVGRRELLLLQELRQRPDFDAATAGRPELLAALARSLCKHRDAALQQQLFTAAAACMATWQQQALLRGAVEALPKGELQKQYFAFAETPTALAAMARSGDRKVGDLVQQILAAIVIRIEIPATLQLSPEQQALVANGARLYGFTCAACHQGHGRGMAGLAPPLRDSEWVQGPTARLLRIALCGVRGPIEVAGQTWTLEMPGHDKLPDDELAAILSYVRQQFGNGGSLVGAAELAAMRQALAGRKDQFTVEELLQVK
jgi:mono/diheme cytochrome c family protein